MWSEDSRSVGDQRDVGRGSKNSRRASSSEYRAVARRYVIRRRPTTTERAEARDREEAAAFYRSRVIRAVPKTSVCRRHDVGTHPSSLSLAALRRSVTLPPLPFIG